MIIVKIREHPEVKKRVDREEIFEYVKKQYGTIPEYLWSSSPDSAVLRHHNGKWYAVIMNVERSKLGLDGDDTVEIIAIGIICNSACHFVFTFHKKKEYSDFQEQNNGKEYE